MAEVHHFSYGLFNPVAAFLLAFLGSFLGLLCTARARTALTRGRRNRWSTIAAFSIGGCAVWLMRLTAMLGFDVPASPVRYHPYLTAASLFVAVLSVGVGLAIAGNGHRRFSRVLGGGVFTGLGLLAMHYTGMVGVQVAGEIGYRPDLVAASALIAVLAATTILWFTATAAGWPSIFGGAAIMAAVLSGMHYLGMSAIQVSVDPASTAPPQGIRPLLMIAPITLVTAAAMLALAFSALQALIEEEFTDSAAAPRHDALRDWSLRQAAMSLPEAPARGPLSAGNPADGTLARDIRPAAPEPADPVTTDAAARDRTVSMAATGHRDPPQES